MYYLLAVGLIILGLIGLYGSIFKYTREKHKNVKFTRTGQGLDSVILVIILELLPWQLVKVIFLFSSALAVFIGIMILITM